MTRRPPQSTLPGILCPYTPLCRSSFGEADVVLFSVASKFMSFGEHTGSHVDAPCHFDADPGARSVDQMPLEDFYTEAVCLDLSHKPPKSDISVGDLERAVDAAGVDIRPRDTVPLHMAHHARTFGTPAFLTDFRSEEHTSELQSLMPISYAV